MHPLTLRGSHDHYECLAAPNAPKLPLGRPGPEVLRGPEELLDRAVQQVREGRSFVSPRSRIRPGRDLHDISGGKLWSNPPKTSSRLA